MNTLQIIKVPRTCFFRLALCQVSYPTSTAELRPVFPALLHQSLCNRSAVQLQGAVRRMSNNIVEEGAGTTKPTPFQKKMLVWGKIYKSEKEIPERVTPGQLRKALDKFRVRVSVLMAAATFVIATIMALIGRKERNEGHSVSKIAATRSQS